MPPLDERKARHLIARTKAATLLDGYRGGTRYDTGALVTALIGLSRLAEALGDAVQSINVNPFLCLPAGEGGVALDALVVMQQP